MKKSPKLLPRLKNNRGVALLMAIFTFLFVATISMEFLEETQVEYITSSQTLSRLKSYYAAKSGIEIGLLRILIYRQALDMAGDSLKDPGLLNQIWQFPFVWPPVLPEQVSTADKSLIGSSVKKSLIDTQFAISISSEGAKIDLNDLASPSKRLADKTKEQVQRIFTNALESDENFSDQYRSFDFVAMINEITDWIDEDDENRNGGGEDKKFPNQPFKTIEELHMVPSMTDDLFDLLQSAITIHGVSGIQVNTASEDVLRTIDERITEEVAAKIIEHRNDPDRGPFNEDSFFSFLQSQGVDLDKDTYNEEQVPLIFDRELNFQIKSTGTYGQTASEIFAIVYDFDTVKERLSDIIEKDEKKKAGDDSTSGGGDTSREEECQDKEGNEKFECLCANETEAEVKQRCIDDKRRAANNEKKDEEKKSKKKPAKGRPSVVYWYEK